jgi:predicted RNase H-like HicB family nuclease
MLKMKQKVLNYNVIFQKEEEGGFSVWVPSLLGCASQGETFEEALDNIKEAIILYLEDDKEKDDEVTALALVAAGLAPNSV